MSIMDTLVTNRTQADVLRLQELTEKGIENMTSEHGASCKIADSFPAPVKTSQEKDDVAIPYMP